VLLENEKGILSLYRKTTDAGSSLAYVATTLLGTVCAPLKRPKCSARPSRAGCGNDPVVGGVMDVAVSGLLSFLSLVYLTVIILQKPFRGHSV
jgi:hypothetical protein